MIRDLEQAQPEAVAVADIDRRPHLLDAGVVPPDNGGIAVRRHRRRYALQGDSAAGELAALLDELRARGLRRDNKRRGE
mgnify:CR=1 FL=1